MSTITEGMEVRIRRTGVVVRFSETGQAVIRWQDGTMGIAHPNDLMPTEDPAVMRLQSVLSDVLRFSKLRGRKESESLEEWLARLPSDLERYLR